MAENTFQEKKFLDKDGVTYLQKKNNQTLQATVEVIGEELERIEAIKAKSAYDIAVDEGFEGSEEEWLASLEGPQGESGVYTGTEEPPEEYDVWINPEGNQTATLATEEYVDNAVAGVSGKSAYETAQEGGYTGTEEEFAEKLAEEAPRAFYVVITDNGDGTFSASETFETITEYINNDWTVLCTFGDVIMTVIQKSDEMIAFAVSLATSEAFQAYAITISSDNSVTCEYGEITSLPNPNALTINGKVYDGSEAVDITIAGGGASENVLLGQTPMTLTEEATVKLVGTGEHSYTIKGKTVADLSTMTSANTAATLTEYEDYVEIKATQDSVWYNSHVDFTVSGLTVGTSYVFAFKGFGVDASNLTTNGYFVIRSSANAELATLNTDASGLNTVTFTATTTDIKILSYPTGNYWWGLGYRTAKFGDMYINEAADGTDRTDIVNKSGTFTNAYALGKLSKGITITATPSCEVYSIESGGGSSSGEAVMPLVGKTVVCFGDSLFGMYTGDTSAPAYIAERTGATVYNVGFGGCRMSVHPTSGYAEFCMWALAKAIAENDWTAQDAAASKGSANFPDQLATLKLIDFGDVDAIVIHYGTNDFNGAVIDNESNKKDYNTLCGALRYSVETLLAAYPKLRIFVSLPAFRFWTADDGTVTYSDTKTNTNGNTLIQFVEALATTAKEYSLPVIDCYYGLGINKINASTFLADGVHHNVDGRKRFGGYIGSRMIAEF